MPRDLSLANGRLLVNFDAFYNLRDIYYPHVGQVNQSHGCKSRVGLWVNGKFSWINGEGWERQLVYADDTLVTRVTAANRELGVIVTARDAIDFNLDVLVRRFEVHNLDNRRAREMRLFIHYGFAFWGNTIGDAAFYHPEARALVAYKDTCYVLMNALPAEEPGWDSWTVGHKDIDLDTGSWRDAEDGELGRNPVAFGSVDCVGAIHLGQVLPGSTVVAHAWAAVGEDLAAVLELDRQVVERHPGNLIDRISDYWRAWVNKEADEDSRFVHLSPGLQQLYKRSLLTVRAQIDGGGAVIAAADSDIASPYREQAFVRSAPEFDPFHGHENYSYAWGRDGAFVAEALDRAGYGGVSRQFLSFCGRVLFYDVEKDWGYMFQRYRPNGSVASNVIPWVDSEGIAQLPIQEDETALVLHALWKHYRISRDWELITPLYRTMVKPIGNFLRDYRDAQTGLPLPSQDLWEERQGVHAFTVATVWAGLHAAANFTEMFGERDLAQEYRDAAQGIKRAAETYLYDDEEGRFVRTVDVRDGKVVSRDTVVDVSLFGLWYFNLFDVADPRIQRTMEAVIRHLAVPTLVGGVARYEADSYLLDHREGLSRVPGNPWVHGTLWVAQYHIRKARTLADLKPAEDILEWVKKWALPSGALSEQLNAHTGEVTGATPLTWTHASFITAIHDYLDRYAELSA